MRPLQLLAFVLLAPLPLLSVACGRGGASSSGSPTVSASARLDAETLFAARCSGCHGAHGLGDGANGKSLDPRPRDFSSGEWQRRVSNDDLRAVIVRGGRASGKSGFMPAFPDLANRHELLDALVQTVRGFEKK
jgi:mono/diheme cytochrome c family protein